MVCSDEDDTKTHDGELDYKKVSIMILPPKASKKEIAIWKNLVTKKNNDWFICCKYNNNKKVEIECVFVQKYLDMFITSGYFL